MLSRVEWMRQVTSSIANIIASEPIDDREPVKKSKLVSQSIIDGLTLKLQNRLQDPTLDKRFVAVIIQHLAEKDIEDVLDYVERKASFNRGKAFVKLCHNIMRNRNLV